MVLEAPQFQETGPGFSGGARGGKEPEGAKHPYICWIASAVLNHHMGVFPKIGSHFGIPKY